MTFSPTAKGEYGFTAKQNEEWQAAQQAATATGDPGQALARVWRG